MSTQASGRPSSAVAPEALDDATRGALERVSAAIWRALLAVERHEAEQRARAEGRPRSHEAEDAPLPLSAPRATKERP